MYHFTGDQPPEPVRLSFRALIPGHIRQYLKDFQIDAIRFMHTYLAKGEFCVYNDESGLGKQAAVAVLLDAACSSKKCLIVVQNDDRYVNGWEFHFSVLTNLNAMVIKDAKDSTDTPHNIYIAKWSTLRTIDDLSKFKFDYIILDNRGQMLNNSFCTSMLLKHYERKINILISSVDITSDLKLLHNVLRLGGRLEPQFSSFKIFEEKFKLPDAKELAYKKVDLEEYFCKRERLANYCKNFRLRRYCHQFEALLPLVKEDRYKINLDLWREKQNATNSESSSIEYVNNQNREDERVKDTQELFEEYCRQRKHQHLQFRQEQEKLLQQKEQDLLKNLQQEKEIIYNVDDEEVASITATAPAVLEKQPATRDNSDEPILMSPLLVVSDSDDTEDVPQIFNDPNDDIEIVDLSSEEKDEHCNEENKTATKETENVGKNIKNIKKRKHATELDKLEEDIVDKLKLENTPKRLTRHAKDEDGSGRASAKRLKDRLQEKVNKTPKFTKNKQDKTKENIKKITTAEKDNNNTKKIENIEKPLTDKSQIVKNSKSNQQTKNASANASETTNKVQEILNAKETTAKNSKPLKEKSSPSTGKNTEDISKAKNSRSAIKITETTPLTSRKTRSIQKPQTNNETPTTPLETEVIIKQEPLEKTATPSPTKRSNSKDLSLKVNSERLRLKREYDITPLGVHHKETRSMQRLTRSAGGSKYLTKNLSLQIDKLTKPKKKSIDKQAQNKTLPAATTNKSKTKVDQKTNDVEKNTQTSIISHRSSQDYESIQCAQRLSGDAGLFVDNNTEKTTTEFLRPFTPTNTMRNSMIPSSLTSSAGFFADSEVIFVPPSNPVSTATVNKNRDHVILLSSSENENSTSQSSSTSRRTRALKPKRLQNSSQNETANNSKVPTFSELLAQQNTRMSAKSPDLFSNCSDLAQLPCSQPTLNSEEPNTPFEGFKIFGSEVKQLQQHYAAGKNQINKQSSSLKKSNRDRSCLDILEKMFEPSSSSKKQKPIVNEKSLTTPTKKTQRGGGISGNKPKKQTPILPSHPIEVIAEAQQQQQQQKRKRSTTSSGVQEDEIFEITNNGTFGSVMRLHSNGDISPVQQTQKSNNTQHNKITNYLIGSTTQNGSQEDNVNNSGGGSGVTTEAGTPSKRQQQSGTQNANLRKSPKGKCASSQATKLTKWFTKPSETVNAVATSKNSHTKKSPIKQVQQNQEIDLTLSSENPSTPSGKRALKRRRLDLAFNK